MYGSLRALKLSARDQFAAVAAEPNTRIIEREEPELPPDVPRDAYDRVVAYMRKTGKTKPEHIHVDAIGAVRWLISKGAIRMCGAGSEGRRAEQMVTSTGVKFDGLE